MILADLKIDGKPRKVILHAPKNGFFFVIDRTNGKFISAKNFVDVNWATGYDAERPADRDAARRARRDQPREIIPSAFGAHNWHPMSFNPQTGLVYLPAQNVPLNADGQQGLEAERSTSRRAARRPGLEPRRCSPTPSRPRASPSAA